MKNWWKRFKKWLALSPSDKWLLLRVAGVVLWIKRGLKFLSFKRFKTLYARRIAGAAAKTYSDTYVKQLVWTVGAVSNALPLSVLCLPQALAVKYFLRGDDGFVLKIGVANPVQQFSAHAWIEKEGEIIIGDVPHMNYIPLWDWN